MDIIERNTRKWFDRAAELLRKPKQEQTTEPPVDLDTDTPNNYNSLPPELVENILFRLDNDSLLACRLVNQQLKSAASKELERRNLLLWTSWQPLQGSWKRIESQFSPTVRVLQTLGKMIIELTLWQLKKVLIHTPNLQVFSISNFRAKQQSTPPTILQMREADGIIISPNLATLRICCDGCELYLVDYLLELCAHQLVNLSVATSSEELLLSLCRRKFEKLKKLEINSFQVSGPFCAIWKGESLTELNYLDILMIYCSSREIDIDDETYMDFIGQFSSTLAHLGLEMAPVSRGCFGYLKKKGIIFSKVRSLTLRKRESIVNWEGTQAKLDVEALFPNVSDVNFVDF
ncbi:unnamed protein product [Orchesella dallaii]|uniref:F-box domain-containing protein n=1 Tax=Orchesella dallaii TaxID=48710 RepID=A0ABP1RVR3_9HEXA